MNRDELMRRLSVTFLEELAEHVRVFNDELLSLERTPDAPDRDESVRALFRAAHSLKGAARAVSATSIERTAHQVEDLLSRIRDGRRTLDPELFELLFAVADGFEQAGHRFAEGAMIDAGLTPLQQRLGAALSVEDSPRRMPAPRAAVPVESNVAQSSAADEPLLQAEGTRGAVSAHGGSARVAHDRLDALHRYSTELSIARRRFHARRDELGVTQEHLGRLCSEWQSESAAARRERGRVRSDGPAHDRLLPNKWDRLFANTEQELLRFGRELECISLALAEDSKALDRVATPLEEQIHRLRLLPFAQACEGLSRVVRDLAHTQRKSVALRIVGAELEFDREIVERLREPLLQLVRNALDHGIEPADERASANKPPCATLTVAAVVVGDTLEITVTDDGRGLDELAIRRSLQQRGYEGEALADFRRAIFLPGLSTAQRVSDLSGRGVGLDIVKTNVERMNGSVSVEPAGAGTRFRLRLPLTLSTLRVLFARVGKEVVALPCAAVEALLRIRESDLKQVADKVVIRHAGAPVATASLSALLDFPADERANGPEGILLLVLLRADDRRAALIVDELLTEQDAILRSLGPRVQGLDVVSSGTLLANGEVALVLQPRALVAAALAAGAAMSTAARQSPEQARRRLLLADDSLTTRTLERSILEAAGYDVLVAVDGASAWQLLQEHGADLLLSDVEMPNMGGLSLTEAVRRSPRFRNLPVILLSSRETAEDRERGLEAGANAYLLKSAFDQTKLLRAIEQLL